MWSPEQGFRRRDADGGDLLLPQGCGGQGDGRAPQKVAKYLGGLLFAADQWLHGSEFSVTIPLPEQADP
jgi:hypothetical protein